MAITALGKLKTNGYRTRSVLLDGCRKNEGQTVWGRRQCRGKLATSNAVLRGRCYRGFVAELELEAFDVSCLTNDLEGKRHMLFLSEYFGLLADRADLSKARLVALAAEKIRPR